MMLVFVYRSADPAILEAKAKDNTASLVIDSRGRYFANLFGATPVFSTEPAPRFVGITFQGNDKPRNGHLWTAPKQGDIRVHPRTKNVPPKYRAEAQRLVKLWNEEYPKEAGEPRTSHLLAALGLNEQVMQGNSFSFFYDKNNVSWIATTVPLDITKFEEVKTSEFDMARAQWHIWQAEMKAAPIVNAVDEVERAEPANEEQA